MEIKMLKDPQIYVSKEARELFDNMNRCDDFKGLENKDLFMLAVIFGFIKGDHGRKNLAKAQRTQSGYTRERYLTDSDNALLIAIAVFEQGELELLGKSNTPTVYSIAEEYANGGINDLKKFIFDNPASFVKKFAKLLRQHYKKMSTR